MVSPTRWTWVRASSWSWWRTGNPGMLQSMGLHIVGHDWVTELNYAWCTNSNKQWTLELNGANFFLANDLFLIAKALPPLQRPTCPKTFKHLLLLTLQMLGSWILWPHNPALDLRLLYKAYLSSFFFFLPYSCCTCSPHASLRYRDRNQTLQPSLLAGINIIF